MEADNAAARNEIAPGNWLHFSECIVNDRDLTLTVKTQTAPREARGITLEPPARAA